jgi:hypothetical protein
MSVKDCRVAVLPPTRTSHAACNLMPHGQPDAECNGCNPELLQSCNLMERCGVEVPSTTKAPQSDDIVLPSCQSSECLIVHQCAMPVGD